MAWFDIWTDGGNSSTQMSKGKNVPACSPYIQSGSCMSDCRYDPCICHITNYLNRYQLCPSDFGSDELTMDVADLYNIDNTVRGELIGASLTGQPYREPIE